MGAWGEDRAAEYLVRNGYVILKRNFHSRFGEIDIIAEKNNTICFVEVKTRKKSSYVMPGEAVTAGKQRKIILTAEFYLSSYNSENIACRFDVIEVFYYISHNFYINHIEGAFEL